MQLLSSITHKQTRLPAHALLAVEIECVSITNVQKLTAIYNNQTKICCVHTRVTFCPVTLEHAYKSHESFLAFACYWTTTCVIQGNQRIFQISFFLNAFCFLGSISPLQKKKKIHYCLSLGFKEPNY
jgi:hypothetical protein